MNRAEVRKTLFTREPDLQKVNKVNSNRGGNPPEGNTEKCEGA